MTETERSRVVELQHQGYGYKKKSTLTGLPLNTVKSFCARHSMRDEDIAERNSLCRNCLKPLEQMPQHRRRYFCSDACGKEFTNYGNDHRAFCSRMCYAQYRRKEACR